jgi:hypothetical protein
MYPAIPVVITGFKNRGKKCVAQEFKFSGVTVGRSVSLAGRNEVGMKVETKSSRGRNRVGIAHFSMAIKEQYHLPTALSDQSQCDSARYQNRQDAAT